MTSKDAHDIRKTMREENMEIKIQKGYKIHPWHMIRMFIYNSWPPSTFVPFLQTTTNETRWKMPKRPSDTLAVLLPRYEMLFFRDGLLIWRLHSWGLSVAPEGSKSFNGCSSKNVLVVECSCESSNQGSNPENPLKNIIIKKLYKIQVEIIIYIIFVHKHELLPVKFL